MSRGGPLPERQSDMEHDAGISETAENVLAIVIGLVLLVLALSGLLPEGIVP